MIAVEYISKIESKKSSLKGTVEEFGCALEKTYDKSYALQKLKMNLSDLNTCLVSMGTLIDDCERWIEKPNKELEIRVEVQNANLLSSDEQKTTECKETPSVLKFFTAPNETPVCDTAAPSVTKTSEEPIKDKQIIRTLNYPPEVKTKVIAMCKDTSVKKVSVKMGISTQTIYSWLKKRANYKKSKRCTTRDLKMEEELINWIASSKAKELKYPSPKSIRDRALELTSCDKFKASIAWYHKFMKRSKPMINSLKVNATC